MADSSHVFSLVGKNLKLNTKEDIDPHLEDLNRIADLQEIHLGGNTFGVEACRALADVLKTKTNLRVADFADIFTGRLISEIPDALRALCDALIANTSLVELNLSDNAFGGRSAEPMVNFLKNNHSFSVLKLNNNGLGVTGGTIVAEALLEAAQIVKTKGLKSNLRTVICGRNRLENGSAPVWAKAYAAHGGLIEVRMFQNGIRMEGIEAISKGLASCPNLEVLDLQDNTATVRGSRAIAACLPSWPMLKTLNLSDCLLKPKGGALVFTALSNGTNKHLERMQLQYCDLDRKALTQLGDAIRAHLPNLIQLEINGNWADEEDECIEKIKTALAAHGHEHALEELDEMDPDGEDDADEDSGGEEDEQDSDDTSSRDQQAAAVPQPDETDELASALAATHVTHSEEKTGLPVATSTEAVERLTRVQPETESSDIDAIDKPIEANVSALEQDTQSNPPNVQADATHDKAVGLAEQSSANGQASMEPTIHYPSEPDQAAEARQDDLQPATDPTRKKNRGLQAAWTAIRERFR